VYKPLPPGVYPIAVYKYIIPYVEIKCQLDATGSSPQTGHTTLNSTLYQQLENQAPNTAGSSHLYDTLELLMIGIKVLETC
jgi:hypothetical protein